MIKANLIDYVIKSKPLHLSNQIIYSLIFTCNIIVGICNFGVDIAYNVGVCER